MGKMYLNGHLYGGAEISGDFACDVLFDGDYHDITVVQSLTQSIMNYDLLIVEGGIYDNFTRKINKTTLVIIPNAINGDIVEYEMTFIHPSNSNLYWKMRFGFVSATSIKINDSNMNGLTSNGAVSIFSVYGLKFGVQRHHYSTSEQIVGTWIDGKPLYEKTIVGNALGNSSTTTTLFTATVEKIQKYDTILKNASNNVVNFNTLYTGSYHYRVVVDTDGSLKLIRSNTDAWQDWYSITTIQYTKTTD